MKKVVVPLTVAGINELIKSVEDYRRWQQEKAKVLLDRLSAKGLEVTNVKFGTAAYDGTPEVTVNVENRGDNVRAVVATGGTVLFIEFGTGVTYPDNHPQAAELGMIRGEYGLGKGKQTTWAYYGQPGTNGVVANNPPKEKDGLPLVFTHGNPANMPMYESVKQLKDEIAAIAREVFV